MRPDEMLEPDFTDHVLRNVALTFAEDPKNGITFGDVRRAAARFPGGLDYWASRAVNDAMQRLDPRFAVGPFDPLEVEWTQDGAVREEKIGQLTLTLAAPGNPDGPSLDDVREMAARHGLSLDAFISWCLAEATAEDLIQAAR